MSAAIGRIRAAGIDSPRLEAELLLGHVLGISRTAVIAHPDRTLGRAELRTLDGLVSRRAAREPLPYLLGRWEFMGLSLRVTPSVLIPRPETETLVEALAARLQRGRLLDVGTGSGCIALALAHLLPEIEAVALDISLEALAVARDNAAMLGLERRVTFVVGGFPGAVLAHAPFTAIAANPPYIPSGEIAALQPEVRDHEPRIALDGGPDGLGLLRPLAGRSPSLLQPGGWLAVEVALGQAPLVQSLLGESDAWQQVVALPDLAGIERVVLAQRKQDT